MSPEKVAVLRALGAEIIRTPTQAAFDSPESHIGVARRLQKELPNAHILDQYGNPDNPLAHEHGTAEEIWTQTDGKVTALVAGAGTGGTITGIARGLRKHNPAVKVIAADPHGSILALPHSLNEEHSNVSYKVEGIGYDFVPEVLDQAGVDKWYKTDDRESFMYARRLIAEEGLLVGGSSGSAMAAMVRAAQDYRFTKDDTIVVVLPDSIRSYLSKFVDDDWLAANDLLNPTADPISPLQRTRSLSTTADDPFHGATIASLRLKPVTTVTAATPCAEAVETMRDKGFDQLPVKSGVRLANGSPSNKLVGLITLGNLLSYLSSGRASPSDPVSAVMFDFSKIDEIIGDPVDMTAAGQHAKMDASIRPDEPKKEAHRRQFVQITRETKLSALQRFFEWNSAAVVTEAADGGELRPVAVVTKVDLLSWLVRNQKHGAVNGNGNGHA